MSPLVPCSGPPCIIASPSSLVWDEGLGIHMNTYASFLFYVWFLILSLIRFRFLFLLYMTLALEETWRYALLM